MAFIHQSNQQRHPRPTIEPVLLIQAARVLWLALLLTVAAAGPAARLQIGLRLPPALLAPARLIAAAGLALAGVEAVIGAVRLVVHTSRAEAARRAYLRIRTPHPNTQIGNCTTAATSGSDLFHAAHELLAAGHSRARPPWLAATISARPDEPVTFGLVVGGGGATSPRLEASVRQLVTGIAPGALIDAPLDPLEEALRNAAGRPHTLAWHEYGLRLPPAYPLRQHAAGETDPLGPLVAALRPRTGDASYAEFQLIVQPRRDWGTRVDGWRALLRRRLDQLKAGDGFALQPETRALQEKLASPAYDTVLRVVALAADPAAARRTLDAAGAALGQYAAPNGRSAQGFTRIGSSLARFPATNRVSISYPRLALALLLLLIVSAGVWALTTFIVPLVSGFWPVLSDASAVLASESSAMPMALAILPWMFAVVWPYARVGAWAWDYAARVLARQPRPRPPQRLAVPFHLWRGPSILSAAELGAIWHMPGAAQADLVRWLPCRLVAAPPRAFVPEAPGGDALAQRRLVIGHARRGETRVPVGPALRDLRSVMHITAGMGTGKSRLLANLCAQVIGEGFTLIDGKGDDAGNLTHSVLDYIGLANEPRVVLLDITDSAWPVGLNPLAGIDPGHPGALDRAAAQVQSIFARLDPEGWSAAPGMQQFLEMGTRLVTAAAPHPTLARVKRALLDEAYRGRLLAACPNPDVRTFWEVVYPGSGEQQRSSLHALMRRFDKVLLSDVLRGLVTQEQPTLDLRAAIERQLIVLVPLPHVTYGPLAATAAMLVFQAFVRAAFERPGDSTSRRDYPLIVDEFQVLVEHGATQDVAAALSQLRALGIPAIYAHQALAQLGDLRDLMLINAENRVILRTQEPDASVYAGLYAASGLSTIDISSQEPNEHQYARFVVGGAPAGPFSIEPLPWPSFVEAPVGPYAGPNWQTIVPGDHAPSCDEASLQLRDYDRELCRLIYRTPFDEARVARLAQAANDEWRLVNQRWQAIAQVQRQHIIEHPGCISDRVERVLWLSRLGFARPRLLAEAEYRRAGMGE